MFKSIANPADSEVFSVIWFLNAKHDKPSEIHGHLVETSGEKAMTDEVIRK